MRKLIACLSLGAFVALADAVPAQQPAASSRRVNSRFTAGLAYRPARPRLRTGKTEADLLIQRKAAVLAQQRTARIELRKWHGVSLSRPQMPPSWTTHTHNLNAALAGPPCGCYAASAWWVAYP